MKELEKEVERLNALVTQDLDKKVFSPARVHTTMRFIVSVLCG